MAQEPSVPPALDFRDLAARFLGYDGRPLVPVLGDMPAIGDQQTFRIPRAGSYVPVEIQAELVSASPEVYIWAETNLDATALADRAPILDQIFSVVALRENYAQPLVMAGQSAVRQPTDLVPLPDVDNDPHLNILFATDLDATAESFVRAVDSLPNALAPGAFGNGRELLLVNALAFPETGYDDFLYLNLIVSAFQELLASTSNPSQAVWLHQALAQATFTRLQDRQVAAELAGAYLSTPDIPLFSEGSPADRLAINGGQQLFLSYLARRFGATFVRDLWSRPGEGIGALEAALRDEHTADLVTGEPVDLLSVFADFVLATVVNAPIGDGRYQFAEGVLDASQFVRTEALASQLAQIGETVQPFGSDYYQYTADSAQTVLVRFDGSADTSRLHLPDDQPADERIYWSGRAPAANPRLTRTVDLTGVEAAELRFDVAHDLTVGWDYGYFSVSTDGGATWTILPATTSSADNRNGFAYGPGFTGISNPEPQRPYPTLGVLLGSDGFTLVQVAPDGPAAQAGLRVGDQIIGHHGKAWAGAPGVLDLLAGSEVGESLPLLIRRNDTPVEIPVVVGAHATRRIDPDPIWQAQTVDLTPYAGQEILLRFETVMQPGQESGGLALRDLAIDAIDWADEGTGEGWTLDGWTTTTNAVPQRWLVQAALTGAATTPARVLSLIGPGNDATSGEWPIALEAGESLLLAVSAVTPDAARPATYDLALTQPLSP